VRDKDPIYEGDERIFTLNDVRRLFRLKRKKILSAALIGALLSFGFFLLKAPKYTIEATFKEGVEKSGGEGGALSEFLSGTSFRGTQPQAIALMKSYRVLKPLVERLGLNATVPRNGGILSKVYRRVRDNFLAEWGLPLPDLDPFVLENVHYEGEEKIALRIQFSDESHFALLNKSYSLGQEVRLPEVSFTLVKAPKNLRFNRPYVVRIQSWHKVAKGLRAQLHIVSEKGNKSIYDLTLHHRDRYLGMRILNELMTEYQRYLKNDHDQVATEQLSYLTMRQDQIFQNLSNVFDEHASYMKRNLGENGFAGHSEESQTLMSPHRQMMDKVIGIDVELGRLDQLEKEGRLAAPADEGPFSRRLLDITRSIGDLRQQRDLLELSLKQRKSLDEDKLEERQGELREVRARQMAAKELLAAFEKGRDVPQNFSFNPERSLAAWADRLKESLDEEREDFADYLDNHIRILSVQEKMLQERFFYGDSRPNQFEGIDLPTVRTLFVEYNNKLDHCEAAMRHYAQLQGEIDQENFHISSLSSVLNDPLSQNLIAQAAQVGLQLKDEKHHSAKEGERWEEELVLQKQILKDHLKQLFKVEELNTSLIQEKIIHLQKVSLDCIHRQISVLNEQASDGIKERRNALVQEKQLLERKMGDLRVQASIGLPEKLRQEKWLDLKTDMGTKMMEALTELVESKTINHHLHHIESKPLDAAVLPLLPKPPGLFSMAFLGAFGTGFGFFLIQLLRTILKGFPSSLDKLRAMRFPILGEISGLCDGPGSAEGSDLELLRQIGLFSEKPPQAKVISLLAGRGPDYSHALAENIARRSQRALIIRCDFSAKYRESDRPGLLQIWKGEISEFPIRNKGGYDVITAGGYTPYGLEVIQSAPFQQLLDQMKQKYDVVLLVFRSPLNTAESLAALRLCDKAVVTASEESTDLLTPFANWAYHEGQSRLTFVVSDHP